MQIVYANIEGLAEVRHDTGTIYLNKNIVPKLPELTQKFIVEHEKGHFFLNTHSEFEADKYALKKIAGTTRKSLKKAIDILIKTLPFTEFSDYQRLYRLTKEAALIDLNQNENEEAQKLINEMNKKIKNTKFNFPKMAKTSFYLADSRQIKKPDFHKLSTLEGKTLIRHLDQKPIKSNNQNLISFDQKPLEKKTAKTPLIESIDKVTEFEKTEFNKTILFIVIALILLIGGYFLLKK